VNLVFVIGPNTTCTKLTNNVFKHLCIQHTVGNKLTHNIITNRIRIASKSANYTDEICICPYNLINCKWVQESWYKIIFKRFLWIPI